MTAAANQDQTARSTDEVSGRRTASAAAVTYPAPCSQPSISGSKPLEFRTPGTVDTVNATASRTRRARRIRAVRDDRKPCAFRSGSTNPTVTRDYGRNEAAMRQAPAGRRRGT